MSFITNISSKRCNVSFTHLYCRCIPYPDPTTLLLYRQHFPHTPESEILSFLELKLLFGANSFLSQCISYTPKSVKCIALFCWDNCGLSRSVEFIFWTKSFTDAMSSTDISLYTWYYLSPSLCVIACMCAVWASVYVCVQVRTGKMQVKSACIGERVNARTQAHAPHTLPDAQGSAHTKRKCACANMCIWTCKHVYLSMCTNVCIWTSILVPASIFHHCHAQDTPDLQINWNTYNYMYVGNDIIYVYIYMRINACTHTYTYIYKCMHVYYT